jgi:nucleoside-diphosphate-sugar epimerase
VPTSTKVVVTGIAGCIGRIAQQFLREHWELWGVDLRSVTDLPFLLADINDQEALVPFFEGAYAVLHLAANPNEKASWRDIKDTNILGTHSVFEATRRAKVQKIVFASSNHVTGLYETNEPYKSIVAGRYNGIDPATIPKITHTMPIRPDGPYGVSKAFGEALGRYYAECFGIQVICLRIGTVNSENRPRTVDEYATLLTHSDLETLLKACLRVEGVPFDIFYGVSANTWRFWDITHAQDILGWTPQEDAERFRQ